MLYDKIKIDDAIIQIDQTTEMEFKDENAKIAWNNLERNNIDDNIKIILRYAMAWAKHMQRFMKQGHPVIEIAEIASRQCGEINITIHTLAFNLLIKNWKYGQELLKCREKYCIYKRRNNN